MELLHPLIRLGPTVRLTKEYVADQIGPNAFENSSNFRLSEWLASQEDNHRIVLYQCDPEITVWTKLCLRHADVVFMLADPKDDNGVKPLERELEVYMLAHREFTSKYMPNFEVFSLLLLLLFSINLFGEEPFRNIYFILKFLDARSLV